MPDESHPRLEALKLKAADWLVQVFDFVSRACETVANSVTESDRGCVLIAASAYDDLLDAILRWKFTKESRGTSKDQEWLLSSGGNPPLQSFGVKIRLAVVLGLIDDQTRKSLDALRRLRNCAAHKWAAFELTSDNIQSLQATLSASEREMLDDGMKKWPDGADGLSEAKARFIGAAVAIAARFATLYPPDFSSLRHPK